MRTVIAVATVLYFLAYTIAQCGTFLVHGHEGDDVHIASSTTSLPTAESAPGHAHIDNGSTHVAHEAHTVVAMPRSDNPLRPLTVAAIVAMALAVVLLVISAPRTPRAPPDLPIPIRHGRTLLNELCINRC
ncbi:MULTISPECIES: hypothetical protein [unclassified Rhodococcus (in: high G+C Gram-positive bacteria)]|jgi:hypothetical protein|nr:membrane protein [Rhodococcus qingshengii]KLN73351.1 membrane protein [Rhodococcus erythropolis]MBT9294669.1 hypothetical protein [Rhodococcus sp. GOMB7]NHP17216.1 hypothetical protein [Rhodococcus sp. IC4_135]QEM25632.1 hypothetical protein D6M20_00125 [Rhodococcus qingshengii]